MESIFCCPACGGSLYYDIEKKALLCRQCGKMKAPEDLPDETGGDDTMEGMASRGEYFSCADTAFRQAATLLRGGSIARPMNLICNILLALLISVLAVVLLLR